MIIFTLDINECLSSPCEHTCANTPGSFTCSCNHGYLLDNDGRSCLGLLTQFNCYTSLAWLVIACYISWACCMASQLDSYLKINYILMCWALKIILTALFICYTAATYTSIDWILCCLYIIIFNNMCECHCRYG